MSTGTRTPLCCCDRVDSKVCAKCITQTFSLHLCVSLLQMDAFSPSLKKKKGKRKDNQMLPALDRIMGYTGSDMSEEEVGYERVSALACFCVRACIFVYI